MVFLEPADVWAFEATHRLTFVHTRLGRFDVDLTLAALDASFDGRLLRVHRNWLVRPAAVRRMTRHSGEILLHLGEQVGGEKLCIPVSRENARRVRQVLLRDARGVRRC